VRDAGARFSEMRYFAVAAESGRISQAAVELNISQSAVTTAIKDLEEALGVALLRRHASGVSLTLDGHRFLAHARHVLSAVTEASRAARGRIAEVEGKIEVRISYTIAGYFLPPLLARFKRSCPFVEINLVQDERAGIERDIIAGAADMGVLLVNNINGRRQLITQTFVRSPRRLWLGADHPPLEKPAVNLRDIAAEPYIMLTVDEAEATTMRYWRRSRLSPRVVMRTSALEAVRGMVAAGLGVTILADIVHRPWSLEGSRIEVRDVVEPVPSLDVGVAWQVIVTCGRSVPQISRFGQQRVTDVRAYVMHF
jgi:DNA-binding transcriptional LysR family regulator